MAITNYNTLVIWYNGRQYSKLTHPYLFEGRTECYRVESKNCRLKTIAKLEETDTSLILSIGSLSCEIDASDNLNFNEAFDNIITFDKTSCKVVSGDRIKLGDDRSPIRELLQIPETMMFCDKIISYNKNVEDYLNTRPKYLLDGLNSGYNSLTFAVNFFNLCTFNLLEFEKLINSNNCKILEANLSTPNFELSEANKLHQILGLPKFATQMIKDIKFEDYMFEIKNLADTLDGNSLKIFLEFIDNMKRVIKFTKSDGYNSSHNQEVQMKKFINDCTFILDKKRNYRITDLLNYLLRQEMYYRDSECFCFPYNEAEFLKDYIEMSETYGLKYEKYPAKVKRAHNLVVKNIQALIDSSSEVNDKFEEAVFNYADVEKVIKYVPNPKKPEEYTEYAFIVPHDIKALIQEGNDMHHCVGSYVNKIIDGNARVVFMRLATKKNESLVTIDIDEHYNLVEAKKAFNEDIDDVQTKVLNKWLKEIKKLAI